MAEKNLDIVIRGRNQAKAAMQDARNDATALAASFIKIAATGAVMSIASKAIAAGVMGIVAARKDAAAIQAQSAADILEAQTKINLAWSELGGSLPIVGEGVKKAMDAWSDVDGIQKAIAKIKEIETATKQYHEKRQHLALETTILEAKLRGASESEILSIQATAKESARKKDIEALKTNEAAALKVYEEALKKRNKIADALPAIPRRIYEENLKTGDRAPWFQKHIRRLEKADAVLADLQKKYESAAGEREGFEKEAVRASAAAEEEIWQKKLEIIRQRDEAVEKAAAERQQSADALTNYLRDEEQRRIAAAQDEADQMISAARRLGMDTADIEAESARRIAEIRREFREREQAEIDRYHEEQRRKAEKAAAERKRIEENFAREKQGIEDIIFNATHNARERELRDIERRFDEYEEKWQHNPEMMDLIKQAKAARMNEFAQGQQNAAGSRNLDVQALSARFLTRAQGREDPRWVQELAKRGDKQIDLLTQIAEKTGIHVGTMNWSN